MAGVMIAVIDIESEAPTIFHYKIEDSPPRAKNIGLTNIEKYDCIG